MLKLIGSCMVVMAGGLAGMSVARNYSRRPHELGCLQSALQMLETEITYTATPLPEALLRVSERADRSVSELFALAGRELTQTPDITAREAWEKAMLCFYANSSMTPADLTILRNLGNNLGISCSADQCKHLQMTMEQLTLEKRKAETVAEKNVKMWNYLGFMASAILVLILI